MPLFTSKLLTDTTWPYFSFHIKYLVKIRVICFSVSLCWHILQWGFEYCLKRTTTLIPIIKRLYLLLRCTGALQGSPRNLLGFKGAVGGSLFTAISHGRIGDVVQTSHSLGMETVQWRHLNVASDCLNPEKQYKKTNNKWTTQYISLLMPKSLSYP